MPVPSVSQAYGPFRRHGNVLPVLEWMEDGGIVVSASLLKGFGIRPGTYSVYAVCRPIETLSYILRLNKNLESLTLDSTCLSNNSALEIALALAPEYVQEETSRGERREGPSLRYVCAVCEGRCILYAWCCIQPCIQVLLGF